MGLKPDPYWTSAYEGLPKFCSVRERPHESVGLAAWHHMRQTLQACESWGQATAKRAFGKREPLFRPRSGCTSTRPAAGLGAMTSHQQPAFARGCRRIPSLGKVYFHAVLHSLGCFGDRWNGMGHRIVSVLPDLETVIPRACKSLRRRFAGRLPVLQQARLPRIKEMIPSCCMSPRTS